MTRTGRFAAALAVAAALAPAMWLGETRRMGEEASILRFDRLAVRDTSHGPFAVEGVWRVSSPHFWFGSYSALAVPGDGTLLAGSDRGWTLRFSPPEAVPRAPEFAPFAPPGKRWPMDLEAFALDQESGTLWAAFEYRNAILRRRPDGTITGSRPPAMRRWSANGGPESMARLGDGRFIVLAEDQRAGRHAGLLFPADPVSRARPIAFDFDALGGYVPVDMAALPDGRVLLLLRKVHWSLPPRFTARLAIADPRAIRAGQRWSAQILATLKPPFPVDNLEGIAVEPRPDGALTVWLISDDNRMAIQRTLLAKLRWMP